jgi:hypothetical protein
MPKNTFISLAAALGGSMLGGIVTLLLTCLLLHNFYVERIVDLEEVQGFNMPVGVLMCFVLPFPVCIGFLLPLAAVEKTRIERNSLKTLLVRYTPFIALPAGFLLMLLLCSDFAFENDRYTLMTLLFTASGICFSALWFFIYRLKLNS